MASVSVLREDPFLSQVERVRREVGTKFTRAHQLLLETEAALLSELDQLVARYRGEGVDEQIGEILATKEQLVATMKGNENKETLAQCIDPLDSRKRDLETGLETLKRSLGSIVLEWDGELESRMSELGTIRVSAVSDYKKKGNPVMVACKHRKRICTEPGVFYWPGSIAIDSITNDVFICDRGNNRVQVFTKSFEFLFQFSEKMNCPNGICINQDKVYVTQLNSHPLNVYTIKGKLLQSVGKKGKKELEFDCPVGIAVSTEKNRIYICDYRNDRIQQLNINLAFNSYISDINHPIDIKLTSEEIVVLKLADKCISYYNYSHQLIKEVITRGERQQVVNPGRFCLDLQNNILMTDISADCVSIFSPSGDLIHKFGRKGEAKGEFIDPKGIALDSENRIIVASCNPERSIQLF